jgi:shikimate kinase
MNIVLTGFMGTGKSAVGKLLAARLAWRFVDLDAMIETEAGMSIAEIFARDGEAQFRDREARTVIAASGFERVVISCGGGVVLRAENMDAFERHGVVVCLTASPEAVFERVKNNRHRPLLAVADPLARIRELMMARAPFYRRCHVAIDTSALSIEDVAEKILNDPVVIERSGIPRK